MNRRKFIKSCIVGLGALFLMPKVFLETKEHNPIKLYQDSFILSQQQKEIRDGLGEWMKEKRDEDIFNAISKSGNW